jgi:hypothetical protein
MFLSDFGVVCNAGGSNFLGILDSPAQIIGLGSVAGLSTEYELTYRTMDAVLEFETSITVDAMTFRCRENPRAVSDGKFSRVMLKKV